MVGILFTARLGSSRLSKKHLFEANSRTFIEWLTGRFANEFRTEIENGEVKLVLATSSEPENTAFEKVLKPLGVEVFYGANSNIPQRHLSCAQKFNMDQIISIDGDDILCSTYAARQVFQAFVNVTSADIIEAVGLPLGMNCSGYTVAYLDQSLKNYKQEKKIETGWGRVFVNPKKEVIRCGNYDIYDKLRLTLDYEDDRVFFATVIDFFGDKILDIKDEKLIDGIKANKFDEINNHLFDIYWDNFNSLKAEEQREA
ncbi:cytidylyltransferase domain-containing protein [Mucilaginibacter ginkgonis]|uniref:Uncharacterized protein n=1 Tax=Mucilaginibacter ginkgonis TaxID=2682091 RepID=A0A6I4I359_9SPHI|nr:hypothetical protein [Mucilaginibacter ginkgonis]QQL50839.1 hypothetical protein GO620_005105 [Mucilaginibacter ginkgonis]